MLQMTESEWLELPPRYQEECDENRTFILVPKPDIASASDSIKASGAEQADEPIRADEAKTKSTSNKKNSSRLQLKGCIQQRCRDDCDWQMKDRTTCSRATLVCSYKCRRKAIAFELAPTDKKTIIQDSKDTDPLETPTTKRKSRRNKNRNRRMKVKRADY